MGAHTYIYMLLGDYMIYFILRVKTYVLHVAAADTHLTITLYLC